MSVNLRVGLLIFSAVFLLATFRLVFNGRLQLKYSLLWMLLGALMLFAAAFPDAIVALSTLMGVGLTSNFVFLCGLLFLLAMCLSLSVIVSWQARDIRSLVQQVALLRKELAERLDARPEPMTPEADHHDIPPSDRGE